ncbi:MAG: hypothetical protein ABI614_19325 [Planctomycetota bacterium]
MSSTKTSEPREATKLTEFEREDREFDNTTLSEVLMYFIAVGLVVGLGLLLNSGIEHSVAYFKQVLGP